MPEFHLMEMDKWLPLAVSLAINLLIVGIFVGSLKQTVKGLADAIATIGRRLDAYDNFADQSQIDRANIRARLEAVEKIASDLHTILDKLSRFQAATEVEHRYTRDKLDTLSRDMQSAQRQLANVAGLRPGVIHEIRGGEG